MSYFTKVEKKVIRDIKDKAYIMVSSHNNWLDVRNSVGIITSRNVMEGVGEHIENAIENTIITNKQLEVIWKQLQRKCINTDNVISKVFKHKNIIFNSIFKYENSHKAIRNIRIITENIFEPIVDLFINRFIGCKPNNHKLYEDAWKNYENN